MGKSGAEAAYSAAVNHDDWLYGPDLAGLEKLWHATTPGPWVARLDLRNGKESSVIRTSRKNLELVGGTNADAAFMAAIHEALPALIAHARRAPAP